MKSLLLLVAILGAVALSSNLAPAVTNAAPAAKKEQAVVRFTEPTILMGLTLKGEYLFVHDDGLMARGEACTSVYDGDAAIPDKLIVRFHCTPAVRAMVAHFTVRTSIVAPGLYELTEFQFPGSPEAHLVPMPMD